MSITPSSQPVLLSMCLCNSREGRHTLNHFLHSDLGVELSAVFGRIESEYIHEQEMIRASSLDVLVAAIVWLACLVQPASIMHGHCVASFGLVCSITLPDDFFLECVGHDGFLR
jgi:hypothetical protein